VFLVLEQHTRAHGGIVLYAPLDIVLTDFDVVQPDLLLFTRERQHLVHPRTVTRDAPDLAVEILSPSTVRNDRGRKRQRLSQHRVREYGLVDPDSVSIEVYELTANGLALAATAAASDRVHSSLLPGLVLTPRELVPPE
jgi:Uma2 family endonuclease